MSHYNKGANAERELIKRLYAEGFAVTRVAGSGVNPLPCPDVIALKKGKIFAFECKARKGDYLAIPHVNLDDEVEWARIAGAEFFVGWKVQREGWFFFKKKLFRKKNKNYMVSLSDVKKKSISFEVLVGKQEMLK